MVQSNRRNNMKIEDLLIMKGKETQSKIKKKEKIMYSTDHKPKITEKANKLERNVNIFDQYNYLYINVICFKKNKSLYQTSLKKTNSNFEKKVSFKSSTTMKRAETKPENSINSNIGVKYFIFFMN